MDLTTYLSNYKKNSVLHYNERSVINSFSIPTGFSSSINQLSNTFLVLNRMNAQFNSFRGISILNDNFRYLNSINSHLRISSIDFPHKKIEENGAIQVLNDFKKSMSVFEMKNQEQLKMRNYFQTVLSHNSCLTAIEHLTKSNSISQQITDISFKIQTTYSNKLAQAYQNNDIEVIELLESEQNFISYIYEVVKANINKLSEIKDEVFLDIKNYFIIQYKQPEIRDLLKNITSDVGFVKFIYSILNLIYECICHFFR